MKGLYYTAIWGLQMILSMDPYKTTSIMERTSFFFSWLNYIYIYTHTSRYKDKHTYVF